MKAGEYAGKDGRAYRWRKWGEGCQHEIWIEDVSGWLSCSSLLDVPAAKAALDALIAEQDAEWVELFGHLRVSPDGDRVQTYDGDWANDGGNWLELLATTDSKWGYVEAYRKGREVALAEHEALREQVRALVEALHREDWALPQEGVEWLRRVRAAADKVQL